jgi:hypothetical protein
MLHLPLPTGCPLLKAVVYLSNCRVKIASPHDHIDNHEDLMTIRNRAMALPPELDDIFTNDMQHRVPQRCKEEDCRCLLIVVMWNTDRGSSLHFGEKGLVLDDTTAAIAQLASSYEKACELSACNESQVAEVNLQLRRRLATRCQGLIECLSKRGTTHEYKHRNSERSKDEEDQTQVTILHRTLLDYLDEGERAQLLLGSKEGDTFDVNIAIMAGLIYRGWEGICEPLELGGPRAADEIDFSQAFFRFRFNLLAEIPTGQHKGELIAAFNCKVLDRLKPKDAISGTTSCVMQCVMFDVTIIRACEVA